MKVVIEMSLTDFKKHVYDTSIGYVPQGEAVAFLNFTERVWHHNPECKNEHRPGHLCDNNTTRTVEHSFRITQILP